MTHADLYVVTNATLHQRNVKTAQAMVSLYWDNHEPAQITVTVTLGEQQEPWLVARSLFVAAGQEWARGSWLGGGDFAVNYTASRCLLSLRPDTGALLICPGKLVEEFIAHTQRIVPCGQAEEEINLARVDEAIERILG